MQKLIANNTPDNKKASASNVSSEFGIPFFDLSVLDKSTLPHNLVSEKLIYQHHVLPIFKRGKHLFIAVSDPSNIQVLNDITFQTRLNTEAVLVEEDELDKAIDAFIATTDTSLNNLLDTELEDIIFTDDTSDVEKITEEYTSGIDEAPIVRFVNKIFLDAIKAGVSDIHLEPYEKNFRIRFRNDGVLTEIANPPLNIANRIISRIKVMSRLDIAERRIPQDGRIKMKISRNKSFDFRVSTCPTLFGEKAVLRILDSDSTAIGIEELGFEPDQKAHFLAAIEKPYGLILVTGPTGSGKTVSLYTGLHILNTAERNISTAEDPIEITVEGINQVSINPKANLTFPVALRAFLRQDPDVIMVGEIRDIETADIAVKAAQTGHLVLSTLHTNDAPQSLNRLMQMGVPAFNVISSVLLIMAQRLARRLCKECKTDAKYPDNILLDAGFSQQEVGTFTAYTAVGCEHCNGGYKGRIGIYQVMPISEAMRLRILQGCNTLQIAEQATSEGVNDLRQSGLLKVMQGTTSIEEIDRITKE